MSAPTQPTAGSQPPRPTTIRPVAVIDMDVPFGTVLGLVFKVMASILIVCFPFACFAWIMSTGSH